MKTEHSQKDESDAHMKHREEGEKMKKRRKSTEWDFFWVDRASFSLM